MNTVQLSSSTEAPTSFDTKRPLRRDKFRRTVASLLVIAALGGGSVALGAAPAQAATSSSATVCFRHSGGQVYTYDVYPMVYSNGSWQVLWNVSQRSVNGCSTWPLTTGYSWAFRAYTRVGNTYYMGTSPTYYIQAGYSYNYGTSYVYASGY